jgi:hypothetical protein
LSPALHDQGDYLQVRVVASSPSLSPKNSTIAELFPEDEKFGSNDNTSKYAYNGDEDNDDDQEEDTRSIPKRPSFIDLEHIANNDDLFDGSNSGVFSIQEGEANTFVSIDDLADTIVEVSTDDYSSSSEDSMDEETLDKTTEASPGSSNASLRRRHSGGEMGSPIRKNSANWRESSVLSPAVQRLSTDIFPKTGVKKQQVAVVSALARFRNLGRKIHMGVRVGRAVKKVQDLHGMKRINQYLIIRALGEGTYGKVKLAEDVNTGKQYAMKVLRKTTARKASRKLSIHSSTDTVAEEIAIMKKLNHTNVVKLYEVL